MLPVDTMLRHENWQTASVSDRIRALQALEDSLATADKRLPCRVRMLSEDKSIPQQEYDRTYGLIDDEIKTIFIHDSLIDDSAGHRFLYLDGSSVNPNEPYMAVETLFHEDRHAYQHHIARNPHLSDNLQQIRDFQINGGDGYLGATDINGRPIDDPEYYIAQPVEVDAREQARLKTNELYSSDSNYEHHHEQMNHTDKYHHEFCANTLGDNYVEEARRESIARFRVMQVQRQIDAESEVESGKESIYSAEDQGISEQDRDLYYGYSQ